MNNTSSNDDMLRELFSLAQKQDWKHLISRIESIKDDRILHSLVGDNNTTTDEQGTLLHIVCSCPNVTTQVIKALLKKAGNDLLLVQDSLGHIALHDAVRSGAPIDVISLLVTSESVQVKDNLCLTPLDHVCERIIMREERHRYEKKKKQEQPNHENDYFWQCARLILVALGGGGGDHPEQEECRMMHACIRAHSSCPLALFQRILKRFAHELKLSDSHGNLSLHIAAGNLLDEEEDVQVIQQVLEAWPGAIRVANESNGNLALDYAILAGRTWSSGCKVLFEAFPEAILISQHHSIPPNHFALVLAELSSKGCIDAMYSLLKAQPELFRTV